MTAAPPPVSPRRFDDSRWFARACAALLAVIYTVAYVRVTGGSGLVSPGVPLWEQNFDQARYWQSAAALAQGNLSPQDHWYPPLYSLLMAPLAWLGESRAQLVVGLALYLSAFAGFAALGRHVALRPVAALAAFLYGTLWVDGMYRAWLWPWNTTLSAALVLWAMALVLRLRSAPARTAPKLALLGALLAAIPCARPVDGVVSAVLGLCLAGPLLRPRPDWRGLAALAGGGLAVLLPYGALYLAIWGLAPSAYAQLSAAFGFAFGAAGWKAYLLLIEPGPWYPNSVALLDRMPWLLASAAGVLAGLIAAQTRRTTAVLALPALAYAVPMLCYRAIVPSGLWLYGNIHYFKWVWLIALLLAWQFVRRFRRDEALSAACLAVVFAATCFSVRPVAAGPDEPARMLVYAARGPVSDNTLYMGETQVIDRAGRQRNLFDYQATAASQGRIYILAQNRDFAGDERVLADRPAPGEIRSPAPIRADGAASAAAFGPLLARYKPVVQFGLPCWLPVYRCPQSQLPPLPAGPAAPR